MSSQPQNFGLSPEQRLLPSIERFLQLADRIFERLHVWMPGIIKSFNPGPPATVSVQPAVRDFVLSTTSQTQLLMQTQPVAFPLLDDVPVFSLYGGGWNVTLPIAVGDECILLFADSALDVWLQNGGEVNNPATQRRHDLSDACAIVGLRSKPRGLSGYDQSAMHIRNDDDTVDIKLDSTGVTITAPKVTVNSTGDVEITGGGVVKIGNTTTIDNKVFLTHTHSIPFGTTGPVL